jgi:tetratricopeptide (TPR) repeat protein
VYVSDRHLDGVVNMTENVDIIQKGKTALDGGDLKSAVEAFEEATRLDTESYEAFVYLAVAYSKQNRYNRAIGALKKASDIKPDSPHVHYNLGQAYEAAGVPKEAWTEYRNALNIDAFYTKAREAMSDLSDRLPELSSGGIIVEGDK